MSMNIDSVQSLYSPSDLGAVAATSTQAIGSGGASGATSAVSVDLSNPGQLFSQLQSLSQSDPAKFKQVTAEIASQLKDAASSQTGKQADFLNSLASRFETASQSGKASDLAPPNSQGAQAHHGGHHHHHVQAASTTGQASASGQASADSVFQIVQGIIANALGGASGG